MSRSHPNFAGFFTTKDELQQLDKLAKQQDRSRSALIRRLIREEIKRVGKSIRGTVGRGFKKEVKDDSGTR